MKRYSTHYVEHLKRGPFPGRVDPWSEAGHYFQQIHSGLIDALIAQLDPQLIEMGYIVGKEASLQIAEGREPDLYIQRAMDAPALDIRWDYELAASEVLAEPGVVAEADIDLQAIHIKEADSGRLVTVVEIISPANKTKPEVIVDYRMRRERLVLEHKVNVMEIDLTRSIKRLVNHAEATSHAYHIAVHLAGLPFRVVGVDFGKSLPRVALPLRGEVVPLELQLAYTFAYQLVTIAAHIQDDRSYAEDYLPFPSLLSDAQRYESIQQIQQWQKTLTLLRSGNGNA